MEKKKEKRKILLSLLNYFHGVTNTWFSPHINHYKLRCLQANMSDGSYIDMHENKAEETLIKHRL